METTHPALPPGCPPEHPLSAVAQGDLAPSPEIGASLMPTPTCSCPVAHQQLSSDRLPLILPNTPCGDSMHIESTSQQARGAARAPLPWVGATIQSSGGGLGSRFLGCEATSSTKISGLGVLGGQWGRHKGVQETSRPELHAQTPEKTPCPPLPPSPPPPTVSLH